METAKSLTGVPAISAAGKTDRGRCRPKNDDAFLIARLRRSLFLQDSSLEDQAAGLFTGTDDGWLLVVADGMGGRAGGDLASRIAVQSITRYLWNVMPWLTVCEERLDPRGSLPGIRQHLHAALAEGHGDICEEARRGRQYSRMGTTLTLAYILWPKLYVAHAGDSRCYLMQNGRLRQLTTDHTLAQQLVSDGMPSPKQSSALHHTLWNALGGSSADVAPEISHVHLNLGDRILLCSDGLTGQLEDARLANILRSHTSPVECCEKLVHAANETGGTDNITAIVAAADLAER